MVGAVVGQPRQVADVVFVPQASSSRRRLGEVGLLRERAGPVAAVAGTGVVRTGAPQCVESALAAVPQPQLGVSGMDQLRSARRTARRSSAS